MSFRTASNFSIPPPPPPPVIVSLSSTDIPRPIFPLSLSQTDLHRPTKTAVQIKEATPPVTALRARKATPLVRASSIRTTPAARATSIRTTPAPSIRARSLSPLTEDEDEDEDNLATDATRISFASAPMPPVPGCILIPRPTNASVSDVKKSMGAEAVDQINTELHKLASSMLDPGRSYTNQDSRALRKFNKEMTVTFPDFEGYVDQWPLKVLTMAHLKYTHRQTNTRSARGVVSAAAALNVRT
ncbi:hypothetical protein C8R43DRAFT_1138394 [Mycena crocata]|nr:hypothetical protein C8R43DRAFT_1138394 [Mycena crocata]